MTVEMHVYEDHRKDSGPPWGVFRHRRCVTCGQVIVIVAKVDANPGERCGAWGNLCHRHNPCLEGADPVVEDGVRVWRIPAKVDC